MRERFSEFFDTLGKEKEYHDLDTHIDLIEQGGVKKWISLLNLKFEYMFRSKEEILQELRDDKAELEKELDYIA